MLDDTLQALRAAALSSTDAGGYFPAMYARVTQRVIAEAAAGGFADAARMAAFVSGFAGDYLDAQAAPESAAGCWQATFEVAGDGSLLIVQQLLLGINAHVNYDLPRAVVRLVDGGAMLGAIRPDFDAVNAILAVTYEDVMGDLDRVTRWTSKAASRGGGHVFNFSLRAARDQAWRSAVRLAGEDGPTRRQDLAALDRLVTALAAMIVRPTRPVRWFVPLLRRFETRDPERVTAALLGSLR